MKTNESPQAELKQIHTVPPCEPGTATYIDYFNKLVDLASNNPGQRYKGKFNGVEIIASEGSTYMDIKNQWEEGYKILSTLRNENSELEKKDTAKIINEIDEISDGEELLDWFKKYDLGFNKDSFMEDKKIILEKFKNKNPKYVQADPEQFNGDVNEEIRNDKEAYTNHIVQLGLTIIKLGKDYPGFSHGFYGHIKNWKNKFGKEAVEIEKNRTSIKESI